MLFGKVFLPIWSRHCQGIELIIYWLPIVKRELFWSSLTNIPLSCAGNTAKFDAEAGWKCPKNIVTMHNAAVQPLVRKRRLAVKTELTRQIDEVFWPALDAVPRRVLLWLVRMREAHIEIELVFCEKKIRMQSENYKDFDFSSLSD